MLCRSCHVAVALQSIEWPSQSRVWRMRNTKGPFHWCHCRIVYAVSLMPCCRSFAVNRMTIAIQSMKDTECKGFDMSLPTKWGRLVLPPELTPSWYWWTACCTHAGRWFTWWVHSNTTGCDCAVIVAFAVHCCGVNVSLLYHYYGVTDAVGCHRVCCGGCHGGCALCSDLAILWVDDVWERRLGQGGEKTCIFHPIFDIIWDLLFKLGWQKYL